MNGLAADKELSYTLQVNNCLNDGAAAGSKAGDYGMKCVAEAVVDAAAAPRTFDAGIVAAVAAIVSATGYAISKKR